MVAGFLYLLQFLVINVYKMIVVIITIWAGSSFANNDNVCNKNSNTRSVLIEKSKLFEELAPELVSHNDVVLSWYSLKQPNLSLAILQLDGFSNLFVVDKVINNNTEKCIISNKLDLGSVEFISSESSENIILINLWNLPKGTGMTRERVTLAYKHGNFLIKH